MAMDASRYRTTSSHRSLIGVATAFLFAGVALGRLAEAASVVSDGAFARGAALVIALLLIAGYTFRNAWRDLPITDPADVAHFESRLAERKRTIGHE